LANRVAPDVCHVVSFLAGNNALDKKAAKTRLFALFPYGYVQQGCKIAGLQRPFQTLHATDACQPSDKNNLPEFHTLQHTEGEESAGTHARQEQFFEERPPVDRFLRHQCATHNTQPHCRQNPHNIFQELRVREHSVFVSHLYKGSNESRTGRLA
jgi:hypothetical protein